MGNDSPWRHSDRRPPLFHYFKQRFAQVTNPAIDSLREDLVMSLTTWLGRGPELLARRGADHAPAALPTPILTAEDLDRVCSLTDCRGRRSTPPGRSRSVKPGWRRPSGAWSPPRSRPSPAARRSS